MHCLSKVWLSKAIFFVKRSESDEIYLHTYLVSVLAYKAIQGTT